ncbi:MAG: nucleotide exchange factor GrpE [Acidimicrobiia bacterium]
MADPTYEPTEAPDAPEGPPEAGPGGPDGAAPTGPAAPEDPAGAGGSGPGDGLEEAAEALESDLDALAAQRDEYLALAQRLQAEFENYKKQAMRRNTEVVEGAGSRLAERLLPVLDACDAALTHGLDDVKPVYDALMDVLEKEGLTLLFPSGEPFDPTVHEAVMHEPGPDGAAPEVAEVLRSGYLWKGRVLRAAMVKVKG